MENSIKTLLCSWFLFAHILALTVESSPGGCQSRQSTMPITRNLGDSVQLLCSDNSPCQGISYAFHHYNLHTGQFEPVHQGSLRLTININTLDNAGEYSCVKECANSEFNCYWNVIVITEVQWKLNETVMLNGSVNGSCTATGNPRPLPIITISRLCDYQTTSIIIDNYTTAVEFRIPQVTKDCQDIYCHDDTFTYQYPNFTRRLNITENLKESPTVNSSAEDAKPEEMNNTPVPEQTMATIHVSPDNVDNDGKYYNNGSRSDGSTARGTHTKIYALCLALILVLLYISLA